MGHIGAAFKPYTAKVRPARAHPPGRYLLHPVFQAKRGTHMFDMRCRENGIEHRLTRIKHPWTNGQVERMNRTIKEATVKR